MKKTFLSVFAFAAVVTSVMLFSSCEEELGLEIGVPQTFETVYRLDPQTGTTFTLSETVSIDLDSVLEANDASRDDIESIEWSATELTRTDSTGNVLPGANFTNVKSVTMSIASTSSGIRVFQNADSAKMASYGTNNPILFIAASGASLNFIDYFANGAPSTLSSTVELYAPITAPLYIKSKVTIVVNARL
jgi:hypothetical protein